MPRLLALMLLLTALVVAQASNATTYTWPNSMNCGGSLQDCINGTSAGDTVILEILGAQTFGRYLLIDESITIPHSLTLTTSPEIDAVFAPDRRITVQLAGVGPHVVTISDLTLRRGTVSVFNNGGGMGTSVTVQRVRINALPVSGTFGCGIEVQNFGGAVNPLISIGDNTIRGPDDASTVGNGICVSASDDVAEMRTSLFRNRVTAGVGSITTGISVAHRGAGSTNISANTVLGPRLFAGISVQRASTGALRTVRVDNNVVVGQSETSGYGIQLMLSDSDVRVVNNTVTHGARGMLLARFSQQGSLSGRVANNLIAYHSVSGYAIESAAAVTAVNLNNLTYTNTTDLWVPGANTLNADPVFTSKAHPSLMLGSPAINAGDQAEIPSGVLFDADGERRIVDAQVDIGAYERNSDQSGVLVTNNQNTSFNQVAIDHFAEPMTPSDRPIVTPLRASPSDPGYFQHLGVYQNPGSPSGWYAFFEDPNQIMPIGRVFSVLNPVQGITSLTHTSSAANVSGPSTRIDHPELNNRPFAIAVPTHDWQGTYHNVPIGMEYSSNRWAVRNETVNPMPVGLTFHVAVAPFLSPNAARYTVASTNFNIVLPTTQWPLAHPLLDDTDCAAPTVGRVDNPDIAGAAYNPEPISVFFKNPSGPGAPGHWFVFAESGSFVSQQTAFNVIIDGHQANGCKALVSELNDPTFRDGFE